MNLYFISGLGSSCHVFDDLEIPANFQRNYIDWKEPIAKESISNYALRMASDIDTTKPFILIGLSFGGIIAQEIAQHFKPEKLILISTIKSKSEIPKFLTFSKYTKVHKIIPTRFFTSDKVISYAFFRKVYSKRLPDIQKYFIYRDSKYLKWSFHQIVNWKPKTLENLPIYHIHGTKDPLFPIQKIKNAIEINKGNHLMIISKHQKISEELKTILES